MDGEDEPPRATVVTPVQSAAHTGPPLHSVPSDKAEPGKPQPARKKVRLAAVGDLHLTRTPAEAIRPLLSYANERADILVLCGDLTDYGRADEARALARELSSLHIDIVAVLGNHDHEGEHPEQVAHILRDARVHVLDG